MKNFNKFSPFLETCQKCGPFHILALEGDLYKWGFPGVWSIPLRKHKEKSSYNERKSESDKSILATVWTFDDRTYTFSKKSLYRNSKGVFFKSLDKKAVNYLILEELPESMK